MQTPSPGLQRRRLGWVSQRATRVRPTSAPSGLFLQFSELRRSRVHWLCAGPGGRLLSVTAPSPGKLGGRSIRW